MVSLRTKKVIGKTTIPAQEISIPGGDLSSDVRAEPQRTPIHHQHDFPNKESKKLSFSKPQTFVTLTIGPQGSAQKFVVHKALISHFSPFFSAAFNSSFIEGETQAMTLTDVEVKPFGLLIHWMYQKEIEGGTDGDILQLAKLWLLGERFLIPKLQNEAMELLYEMIEPISSDQMMQLVTLVYETKLDFPLKQIVLQRFIRLPLNNLEQWFDFFPAGMLADVAMAFANHVDGLPAGHKIMKGPVEKYHVEEQRASLD